MIFGKMTLSDPVASAMSPAVWNPHHYLESFLFSQERPSIFIKVEGESDGKIYSIKKGKVLGDWCIRLPSPRSKTTLQNSLALLEGTCLRFGIFCDQLTSFYFKGRLKNRVSEAYRSSLASL